MMGWRVESFCSIFFPVSITALYVLTMMTQILEKVGKAAEED